MDIASAIVCAVRGHDLVQLSVALCDQGYARCQCARCGVVTLAPRTLIQLNAAKWSMNVRSARDAA